MADVQALEMDVITEKSNHQVVGMAVSPCLTPPAPPPVPYPLVAMVSEGISDSPLRTKVSGTNCATIGSVLKTCHGNEPGVGKEVVSLNQMGPVAPTTGAFTVLIELGAAGITGSLCDMNKAPTPGIGSNAGGAGGAGGGGGGAAGSGGGAPGPSGPSGPSGGGSGSGGSAAAASASAGPTQAEKDLAAAPGNSQAQIDARKKVAADFYKNQAGFNAGKTADHMNGIDFNQPVKTGPPPPIPSPMNCYQNPGGNPNTPGQYFAQAGNSPTSLGIANEGAAFGPPPANQYGQGPIGPKESTTYNMNQNSTYMQSTAAPVQDTWSSPANASNPTGTSYQTQGGGTQYCVPYKANSGNPPQQVPGSTTPYGGGGSGGGAGGGS
jgi:hypothetical protein